MSPISRRWNAWLPRSTAERAGGVDALHGAWFRRATYLIGNGGAAASHAMNDLQATRVPGCRAFGRSLTDNVPYMYRRSAATSNTPKSFASSCAPSRKTSSSQSRVQATHRTSYAPRSSRARPHVRIGLCGRPAGGAILADVAVDPVATSSSRRRAPHSQPHGAAALRERPARAFTRSSWLFDSVIASDVPKILDLDTLAAQCASLRAQGKAIVHCHGVFDLLHVGHIRHFKEARDRGAILVVTLTQDSNVNKGPNRPAFTESLRAEAIAALEFVDYVAISRYPTAVEAIERIRPAIYAKGPDYRDAQSDHTGGINKGAKPSKRPAGPSFSPTGLTWPTLINRHFRRSQPRSRSYSASRRL